MVYQTLIPYSSPYKSPVILNQNKKLPCSHLVVMIAHATVPVYLLNIE